jgi:cell shape-determining protein MreC
MRSGAYDFVQKPFNIDELTALVEKAMEKSELRIMVALYESSNAIFFKFRFGKSVFDLEDFIATLYNSTTIFVAQIAQTINNTKLYEKLKVKVAELEQTLVELESVKKEIQTLKKKIQAHVFKK